MKRLILLAVVGMMLGFTSIDCYAESKGTQKEIKIMFADNATGMFDENKNFLIPSMFATFPEAKKSEKTSINEMLKAGWMLHSIVPLNAKQYLVVFSK